jgi:hypothetical protein
MPIERLGLATPAANTDFSIATFEDAHLVSVICSNKAAVAIPVAKVTVYVVPSGATLTSQYVYICYNLTVDVGQSFETFRFAVNSGDTLFVRSANGEVSFSCFGILQDDAVQPSDLVQQFTNKTIRGVYNTIYLDSGNTASRRIDAEEGYTRYNTEYESLEIKTSTNWELVGSTKLVSKTVSELSTLVASVGSVVFCTDESGGSVPAFYDGTDWRRFTDRQIVS